MGPYPSLNVSKSYDIVTMTMSVEGNVNMLLCGKLYFSTLTVKQNKTPLTLWIEAITNLAAIMVLKSNSPFDIFFFSPLFWQTGTFFTYTHTTVTKMQLFILS